MVELLIRGKSLADQVEEHEDSDDDLIQERVPIDKGIVSIGSTQLDLAISGGRVEGGGIPGGIIVEIFGATSVGKTALLNELCRCVQRAGGEVRFLDPEARLDRNYSKDMGIDITKNFDYHRPDTVSEMFDLIWNWTPSNPNAINLIASDSLAALSTDLELSEKGDKMGMRRGKEFSEGLRKTCRRIEENGWIIACTNQLREGDKGEFTPGGKGIPYYASLRIRLSGPLKKGMKLLIERTKTVTIDEVDVKHTKVIGVNSWATIVKSTVDDPFRQCHVPIMFRYGVDDIRGNLQFIKDKFQETTYHAYDKRFQGIADATLHIEEENHEQWLKDKVIKIINLLDFEVKRKPK